MGASRGGSLGTLEQMIRPVILRRAARVDFDEAGDWYEQRRPGKGEAFKAAVQHVLDRVAANPKMHGLAMGDVRKAVVYGFPYCVYYRERGSAVVVLSVFHTSRDPAIWQARV